MQGDEIWFGTYAGGTTLYDRSKKTFQVFTTKGEPPEKDDGVAIKWKNHPAYNDVTVILPDKDRIRPQVALHNGMIHLFYEAGSLVNQRRAFPKD